MTGKKPYKKAASGISLSVSLGKTADCDKNVQSGPPGPKAAASTPQSRLAGCSTSAAAGCRRCLSTAKAETQRKLQGAGTAKVTGSVCEN